MSIIRSVSGGGGDWGGVKTKLRNVLRVSNTFWKPRGEDRERRYSHSGDNPEEREA